MQYIHCYSVSVPKMRGAYKQNAAKSRVMPYAQHGTCSEKQQQAAHARLNAPPTHVRPAQRHAMEYHRVKPRRINIPPHTERREKECEEVKI